MLLNLKNEHLNDNSCRFFKAISIKLLIINNSYPTGIKKPSLFPGKVLNIMDN